MKEWGVHVLGREEWHHRRCSCHHRPWWKAWRHEHQYHHRKLQHQSFNSELPGASKVAQPLSLAAAYNSWAREGSLVVISTYTPPFYPWIHRKRLYLQTLENTLFTQSDLSDISRITKLNTISKRYPTMEKTISEFSATSRGLLAKVAPLATKGSHLLKVLLNYNKTISE